MPRRSRIHLDGVPLHIVQSVVGRTKHSALRRHHVGGHPAGYGFTQPALYC